jgi:hypothetical protein
MHNEGSEYTNAAYLGGARLEQLEREIRSLVSGLQAASQRNATPARAICANALS